MPVAIGDTVMKSSVSLRGEEAKRDMSNGCRRADGTYVGVLQVDDTFE